MQIIKLFVTIVFFTYLFPSFSQVNPVIKAAGGIYEIPDATFTIDKNMEYKIVVDLTTGGKESRLNYGWNNVARMINLHAVAGLPRENLSIVLVVHGSATKTVMDHEKFREKYKADNPNKVLIQELLGNNVRIMVCGQSLIARGYESSDLIEGVEVSVSALTAVTTFQLKGYSMLKFD